MADITMCDGNGCPQKNSCVRYLSEPDKYQSFFIIPDKIKQSGNCEEYWESKDGHGFSADW